MLRATTSRLLPRSCTRAFQTSARRLDDAEVERVSDDVDVCIVGGGPAGLSAAIRLKQLEQERGRELRVVVVEKGGEIGSHVLSGAVIEPRALNELIPDWSSRQGHPLTQPATSSAMRYFTERRSFPIPHPPQMNNTGNYIVSLSQYTAWLGTIAEDLGVELYPGFAGASLVYTADGHGVAGVQLNDVGVDRKGSRKDSFEPGMEFRAKVTLLAEGARGSLTKTAVRRFQLAKDVDPQTYGFGVKEVWRVDPSQYRPGEVVHTMGWPLGLQTYGGGWVYHMAEGLVSLGLVIGLDYANPYLSPYRELQRMKHHPYFAELLSGDSTRVAYGARVLNEGGLQSVPKLHFPGGALIGCSAGFVNVAKIKGTHNAMKTGMLAAEAAYDAIAALGENNDAAADMGAYERAYKDSWVYKDLHEVRNLRPSFNTRLGVLGGIAYSGIDSLFLKGRTPWTFRNSRTVDALHTRRAAESTPIDYPPPQPPLSTDLMTALALTGTNHAEDQPAHLRVRTEDDELSETAQRRAEHVRVNVGEYAGLLGRACPAGVYEYVADEDGSCAQEGWDGKKLVINAQVCSSVCAMNCIHCKLCDVKVPTQDIQWTVPEGGGGPKYSEWI
ncbi:FAD/NAD-P-binding domain-containing protein [Auriscalpium vulgare]|uniref:FAD/NAD-P-binding domain-containing protein n=1 Tax=Auriscalpium vulgare TaxID=40419 RepID=A0ACB8RQ83_9AGAM|nr:FAD/NAD-P-binding domain-containing protein [Auriscalpium vulgare]